MQVRFDAGFNRDLRHMRNDANLRRRVERAIAGIESAPTLSQIPGIARMTASGAYYRIRIGDYRLGFEVEGDIAILISFGHRKEIYRRFP